MDNEQITLSPAPSDSDLDIALYKRFLVRYFNKENLDIIVSNLLNKRDPLVDISIDIENADAKKIVERLLRNSLCAAVDFMSHLTDDALTATINKIFDQIINDHEISDGKWSFLRKIDLQYDYDKAEAQCKGFYLQDRLHEYPDYISNAWNTVIGIRALLKWVNSSAFKPSFADRIKMIIEKSFQELREFYFAEGGINKYPRGFADQIINIHDTAFVSKMINIINSLYSEIIGADNCISVQKNVELLLGYQNNDGGWPSILIRDGSNIRKPNEFSDIGATAYVLMFMLDLKDYRDATHYDVSTSLQKGLVYLLDNIHKDGYWANEQGEIHIENTCLALQVLNRYNIADEFRGKTLWVLKQLINSNLNNFIFDNRDPIVKELHVENDELIRILTMIMTTFLKSKMSIKTPLVNIPFTWLIGKTDYNRSDLIHEVCCISDYLEAERSYLLYGENVAITDKDFIY